MILSITLICSIIILIAYIVIYITTHQPHNKEFKVRILCKDINSNPDDWKYQRVNKFTIIFKSYNIQIIFTRYNKSEFIHLRIDDNNLDLKPSDEHLLLYTTKLLYAHKLNIKKQRKR